MLWTVWYQCAFPVSLSNYTYMTLSYNKYGLCNESWTPESNYWEITEYLYKILLFCAFVHSIFSSSRWHLPHIGQLWEIIFWEIHLPKFPLPGTATSNSHNRSCWGKGNRWLYFCLRFPLLLYAEYIILSAQLAYTAPIGFFSGNLELAHWVHLM